MEAKSRVEGIMDLIWGVGIRLVLYIGVGYFLYRVRSVIIAVLLAAVLTYAVQPVVDFLCRYHVRGMKYKTQRLVATILVFVVLISLCVSFTLAFLGRLEVEMASLKANSGTYLQQLQTMLTDLRQWHTALPPDLQNFVSGDQLDTLKTKVIDWTSSVLGTTVNWLGYAVEVFLIPVLAFYFALDSRSLKHEFVALVPRRSRREALALLHEVNCVMRSYVIGQIILCVIAAVVVGAILSIAGLQYVFLLSILSGVTRAVPIVGPIVAGVVIVLLAAIRSPVLGLYMLIAFSALHFIESKFIMPKLIGHRMQLHPALVIVVLLIGAEFFGVLGMFMAAPVAAIVRTLVRYYIIKPKELRVWGLTGSSLTAERAVSSTENV